MTISSTPDSQIQKLDVYRPVEAEENKLPVIVSVHGGGWVYGDKERYQYYCMHLAQMGFSVVNFTYRLAPEFKFPAPLEDTNLVMEWILKTAASNLDTEHIFGVADFCRSEYAGRIRKYLYELNMPGASHLKFPTVWT